MRGSFRLRGPARKKPRARKCRAAPLEMTVVFCRPKRRAALKDGLCKTMKDGGLPAAGRRKVAATKT